MEHLSPHEHLLLAQLHINDAIEGLEINQAFAAAAFESRITQYGHICAQRALLLRIQNDLTTILRSRSSSSLVDSTARYGELPSQHQGRQTLMGVPSNRGPDAYLDGSGLQQPPQTA